MGTDTREVGQSDERGSVAEAESLSETLIVVEPESSGQRKSARGRNTGTASERPAADGSGTEAKTSTRSQAAKKAAQTKAAKRKAAEQAAGELSTLLVEMLDFSASTALGPEAAMTPTERGMVEPSLSNILNKTSDAAIARFVGWADVLMLSAGMGLWLMRLNGLRQQRAQQAHEEGDQQLPLPGITVVEESDLQPGNLDRLWQMKVEGEATP